MAGQSLRKPRAPRELVTVRWEPLAEEAGCANVVLLIAHLDAR